MIVAGYTAGLFINNFIVGSTAMLKSNSQVNSDWHTGLH
jgi:hypothetical protein